MAKNKPAWEVRIGSIRAVAWQNENKNTGQPWFNVEINRRFKQGDEYKDSSSFNGLADLCQVKQAVELAIGWLSHRELDQKAE